MYHWLKLADKDRLLALGQVSAQTGIPVKAVEKDWWVTVVLKAIFQTEFAPYLLFKGGTSLSKCWHLIDRFSEDVDIAIDPAFFTDEIKLSRSAVKRLKKHACLFTTNDLAKAIQNQLASSGIGEDEFSLTAGTVLSTMTDKDPQELYLSYKPLTGKNGYLTDSVKIEVSVKSLRDPFEIRPIQSMLVEHLPVGAIQEAPAQIPAVDPRRTFLEKLFLLHEEFQKEDQTRVRHFRMSRHLYDLYKISSTAFGAEAVADEKLYDTIIAHREIFYGLPGVDYKLHARKTLSFIPPEALIDMFEDDYKTMQEVMIYGHPPSFIEIIAALQELQQKLNTL